MPMHITFELSKTKVDTGRHDDDLKPAKIRWDALTSHELAQYQVLTDTYLGVINLDHSLMLCDDPNCNDRNHLDAIDKMYESIVSALKSSGEEFLEQRASHKKSKNIPGWNEYCSSAHADARDAFLLWVYSGRPHSGFILRNMQCTRAAFKQALRRCRASESRAHADSLARKLLMKDSRKFWAEIKKLNGKNSTTVPSTIGTTSGAKAIAELWRTHYSGILNSIPPDCKTRNVKNSLLHCTHLDEEITASEIQVAIAELKLGKASGLDSLSVEHFRYACKKLSVLLRLCFNAMLLHGHMSKSFSDTILVPIIKDKKGSVTDLDNYRPIAITGVASKIFEKVMLMRLQGLLHTSDHQFSFKPKHATDMCIFTLKSIIDYYISSSSPIYVCYLDASKAFDRINYWCLFDKLLARNVPKLFVRFLMVWYCSQKFIWFLYDNFVFC